MKSTFVRGICRILVASMIALPMQAQAGLIGTDQAARTHVTAATARGDVAAQLQALGLSPEAASERVASLTDSEVVGLAGRSDVLPAGGNSLLAIAVLIFLLWRFTASDQAKAESAKPGAKSAPEKK